MQEQRNATRRYCGSSTAQQQRTAWGAHRSSRPALLHIYDTYLPHPYLRFFPGTQTGTNGMNELGSFLLCRSALLEDLLDDFEARRDRLLHCVVPAFIVQPREQLELYGR